RGAAAIADRLFRLSEGIRALIARLRPEELALEEAFYGKSVQSALRIGEARGIVIAEARRQAVLVFQFSPARIKRSLTGHGGAGKEAAADMARRALDLKEEPRPPDVSDALAVALCRFEARRTIHSMDGCIGAHARV